MMFKKLPVLLAVLFYTASASAAGRAGNTNSVSFRNSASTDQTKLLENVALNSAESARTITLSPMATWAKLRVSVYYTYGGGSAVTAEFSCSLDGTNYTRLTSRSVSSGTSTVSLMTDTHAVSADSDFMLEYDIRGCKGVKVVFGATGAGILDRVDIQATAVVGD